MHFQVCPQSYNTTATNRAEIVIGKDVQASRTDELCKRPWVCKIDEEAPPLRKRLHYRLVCSTVGYGLQRFRGTEELLHATYDAFQGAFYIVDFPAVAF